MGMSGERNKYVRLSDALILNYYSSRTTHADGHFIGLPAKGGQRERKKILSYWNKTLVSLNRRTRWKKI